MSQDPPPNGAAETPHGRTAPDHVDPADVPLEKVMGALSDPVRLTIVRALATAPDWSMRCGEIDLPVGKATRSHHLTVLRQAGVLEQMDVGARRVNRLRRDEFEAAYPGLLDLVLRTPDAAAARD